jgi:hypothetical protein
VIARLPQELRSGIVPRILNWFLTTSNMPVHAIDPRSERLPDLASWEELQGSIRAAAYRTPYEPIVDYMDRWWFMPEIFGERARLHRIRRSDHDRHMHDHPWHFVSVILEGGYTEEIEIIGTGIACGERRRFRPGDVLFRHAEHRHRLELDDGADCWSLVFTSPNARDWGFWTAEGFVPAAQYGLLEVPA